MAYSASDHTFVVCAYKNSPYLHECVDSVVNQLKPTNVLIATSTPNEGIRQIAQEYGIECFVREGTSNIADDWNFAISCASTPLVTIAHQDDTYDKSYSTHMLDGINSVNAPLLYFTNYGELRDGAVVDSNNLLKIKRKMLWPLHDGAHARSRFIRRTILSFGSAICCPSVTMVRPALSDPLFSRDYKCDLDWDAWERASRLEGSFFYDTNILMHHRIHGESETSALIQDSTRTQEDLKMFMRFWPAPVARIINSVYIKSQKSNG